MNPTSDPPPFYGALGSDYDLMTRDVGRWEKIAEQYRSLLKGLRIETILDAGCGTGGEALALAQAGYRVTGIDSTPEFIEIARRKAGEGNFGVEFGTDDLRSLATVPSHSQDLIVCRGNTLPHLLTRRDLIRTFKTFKRVARSGSALLLQWLNYPPLLKAKNRLIGITGAERVAYIRFYDFDNSRRLRFNILKLKQDGGWQSEWISTELRPWMQAEVISALKTTGWGEVQLWSDLERNPFDAERSRDVVVFAAGSAG